MESHSNNCGSSLVEATAAASDQEVTMFKEIMVPPKKYFLATPISSESVFDIHQVYSTWNRIKDKISANNNKIMHPTDDDAVEMFSKIHIKEDDFETPNDAVKFWETISKLIRVGGHLVSELTMELFESDNIHIRVATRELKVEILTEIPKTFPNLKAFKIIGTGMTLADPDQLKDLIKKAEEGAPTDDELKYLEFLEVDRKITASDLSILVDKIYTGGPYLQTVNISCSQLHMAEYNTTMPLVTTVYLSAFGDGFTTDAKFIAIFLRTFPRIKNLFLHRMSGSFIWGLHGFIQAVTDARNLDILGVDQTCVAFMGDKTKAQPEKIKGIPVICLDFKSYLEISLSILDHATNYSKIVICNYDLCEYETKEDLIKLIKQKISLPSISYCCKITSIPSFGLVEEVEEEISALVECKAT